MGFEPTTPGLKVRSSTAELQALDRHISYVAMRRAANRECASHGRFADNLPTEHPTLPQIGFGLRLERCPDLKMSSGFVANPARCGTVPLSPDR